MRVNHSNNNSITSKFYIAIFMIVNTYYSPGILLITCIFLK